MGSVDDKKRPAAPAETFARFQAGFLSSADFLMDFLGFSLIFRGFLKLAVIYIDLHLFSLIFIDFYRFSLIFMGFRAWDFWTVRNDLLPQWKPLLDSRLASCHLTTFIIDFH